MNRYKAMFRIVAGICFISLIIMNQIASVSNSTLILSTVVYSVLALSIDYILTALMDSIDKIEKNIFKKQ